MARIFISHAGENREPALQMLRWLDANGWPDVFLDLDPEQGIRAGEAWQKALLAAADRCEAIICLLTPEWVASKWCWTEYVYAKKLGKRCFPVIARPIDWDRLPPELRVEHQIVDLVSDAQGWTRLRIGLTTAGVDATSFALPPGRRPYPGLAALTEDDAALFFGRDTEILAALDELRRMAETPTRRLFVILGPSGAGKSSLLRAGLWPRLSRDDRNFLPLPTIRPRGAILTGPTGFWASVEGACRAEYISPNLSGRLPRSRGEIRSAVGEDDATCAHLLDELARAAAAAALLEDDARPTIIIPIDQGEELFIADGRAESERFLTLIGHLLAAPVGPIAAIAIRTEAYPKLQAEGRIGEGLHRPFNLAPMPRDRFRAVIEGPARCAGVELDPALIDALVRDATGADALPLLAFTIERLHREFGAAGRSLRLADYEATGGVRGAIEAAVEEVFRAASARGLPGEREALERLTRRVFLPHLVRVGEAGEFARRTASPREIPDETHALLKLFVEHRLLVRNRDPARGDTVEIAHEALLRAWPKMVDWLKEESGFLSWREEIAHNRERWETGKRDLLAGIELASAVDWRTKRAADISAPDLAFLRESEQHAAAEAGRRKRLQSWVIRLATTAALVFAVAGGTALWQWFEAVEAKQEAEQQARLSRARELAIQAENVLDQRAGETTRAGLLAIESLRAAHTIEGYNAWRRVMELTPGDIAEVETPWPWSDITLSPDQRLIAFSHNSRDADAGPAAGSAELIDAGSGAVRNKFRHAGHVSPVISSDGRWLAVSGYGRKLQVIEVASAKVVREANYDDMAAARFDPASARLFVARTDGVIEVREAPTWEIGRRLAYPAPFPRAEWVSLAVNSISDQLAIALAWKSDVYVVPINGDSTVKLSSHRQGVEEVLFDATGGKVVTRSWDDTVRIWDARSGALLHTLEHPWESSSLEITALTVGNRSSTVVSATRTGQVSVWDAEAGQRRWSLSHKAYVNDMLIAPGDRFLVTASDDRTVRVWDLQTGEERLRLNHDDEVWTLAITSDGKTVATGGKDEWVRFFDLPSGTERRRVRLDGPVKSLAFAPGSNSVAAGVALSKHAQAWTDVAIADFKTRKPVSSFSHPGGFIQLAFSPDGETLATTSYQTADIELWDVASGALRRILDTKAQHVFISPDGRRLVTDPGSGEAFVLDVADGQPLAAIGELGGVEAFGLAGDGHTLTTYGADGWFRGWNALTGRELWKRKEKSGKRNISLSADGMRFARLSGDESAVEIGTPSDGHVATVIPVKTPETGFVLSADGRRLLLTMVDSPALVTPGDEPAKEIELWNVNTSRRLLGRRFPSPLWAAGFLERGNRSAVEVFGPEDATELIDTRDGTTIWAGEKSRDKKHILPFSKLMTRDGSIWNLETGKTIAHDLGMIYTGIQSLDHTKLVLAVDQHVEVRDSASGGLLYRLEAGETVLDLCSSRDGQMLFAKVGDAMRLIVWNLQSKTAIARIDIDDIVSNIEPLVDPDLLLVHDVHDRLRVWRVSNGKEERRFGHSNKVWDMDVATVADRVVTWEGASVRLWDTRTGAQIAHHATRGVVEDLAISPDGRWVGYRTDRPHQTDTGETYDAMVLWEPDSGRDPRIVPFTTPGGQLVFSPDSKRLAARLDSGMDKEIVAVWDVGSLRPVADVRTLTASTGSKFAFSPDGKRLFVHEGGLGNSSLRVWDLGTSHEMARVDLGGVLLQIPGSDTVWTSSKGSWRTWSPGTSAVDPITPWRGDSLEWLARTPVGGRLLSAYSDGSVTLTDVDTGDQTAVAPPRQEMRVDTADIARNERFVALGYRLPNVEDESFGVEVFDLRSGSSIAKLSREAPIWDLSFVANGEAIVVAGKRAAWSWTDPASQLVLWRWRTGEAKTLIEDNPINTVTVKPDGSAFATGEGEEDQDEDRPPKAIGIPQARVWDAQTGAVLLSIPHPGPVYRAAFSPDGQFLATRSLHEIRVYRVRNGSKLKSFRMKLGMSGGEAMFTRDGTGVIANVEEGVRIWSLDGKESRLLPHTAHFPQFRISGDGHHIATLDGTMVRVWDIDSAAEMARVTLPRQARFFVLAGKQDNLIVNSDDRLVRVLWRTEDLIKEACRRLMPNLTEEDRRRFQELHNPSDSQPNQRAVCEKPAR